MDFKPGNVLSDQDRKLLRELPAKEFNDRRAKNDLPFILQELLKVLPLFQERTEAFWVTKELFCIYPHTGDYFQGIGKKELVRVIDDDSRSSRLNPSNLFLRSKWYYNWLQQSMRFDSSIKTTELLIEFIPYFDRLKSRNIYSFEINCDPNPRQVDSFYYYSYGHSMRQAHLFTKIPVLSIWDIEIDGMYLAWKNLDFLGLDQLVIHSNINQWPSTYNYVNFSSTRGLIFRDITREIWSFNAFLEFSWCEMDEIKIYNAHLQDIHFNKCGNCWFSIYNSTLLKFEFHNTYLDFTDYERIKLTEFSFHRQWLKEHSLLSKMYGQLGHIYLINQDLSNARSSYYHEKVELLKSLWQELTYKALRKGNLRKSILNLGKLIWLTISYLVRWFGYKIARIFYSLLFLIVILFFINQRLCPQWLRDALLVISGNKSNPTIIESIISIFWILLFWLLVSWYASQKRI